MGRVVLPGREDDGSTVVCPQLMREPDSRARNFQIDVDERHLWPALAGKLQRLGRRMCRTEDCMSRVFEHRGGTVGNNRFVFDDQHNHHDPF